MALPIAAPSGSTGPGACAGARAFADPVDLIMAEGPPPGFTHVG